MAGGHGVPPLHLVNLNPRINLCIRTLPFPGKTPGQTHWKVDLISAPEPSPQNKQAEETTQYPSEFTAWFLSKNES